MNSSSCDDGLNTSEKKTPPLIHGTWINKLLGCIPLKAIWTKNIPPVPPSRCISKEESAGILSLVTFQWMSSLLSTGYKRSLELNDIWLLPRAKRVVALEPKVTEALDQKATGGAKRPLLWAIYETLRFEILLGGFCQLMASVLPVVNPFLLKYLVAATGDAFHAQVTGGRKDNHALSQSIGIVLGMASIQLIQCFCTNQALYRGMSVGGQSRGVLISLIFDKSMRLPRNPTRQARTRGHWTSNEQSHQLEEKLKHGRKSPAVAIVSKMAALFQSNQKSLLHEEVEWNHGEIINLMSVHTYRVDQAAAMLHFIWTTPIAVLLGLILLILNISYSALAGFGFLIVAIPVLGTFIDMALSRRKNVNTLSDQRVTLTHEALKYVRFLKYFAWESNFMDRIVHIRTKEIRAIRGLLATRNGIMAISSAMPVLATVISVTVLSVTGHTLEPASIFSSLAIFNSLRLPLNYLPLAIGLVVDGISSISRIEKFLFLPEPKDETQWEIEDTPFAIKTEELSFCWEEPTSGNFGPVQDTNLNLQDPQLSAASISPPSTSFSVACGDLDIAKGELVAIIGLTGAGKTSFLEGLAGNMFKTSGNLRLNGNMAFCSQDIWIQNATIRENILFGQDYEADWYRNVIDACCLENDFALFQHGDLTEIGERGVTCSGGQKQRISLARAIYRRPQIILLDDPLSAVDAKVGLHIMKEAICGLLNNSCRILATHQTWVLDKCDRILYVEKGKIGTFDSSNILQKETTMRALAVGIEEDRQQPSEDSPELGDILNEPEQSHRAEFGSSDSPKTLMQAEEHTQGSIPFRIYWGYARASGSSAIPILLLILLALAQTGAIMTGLWLSYWIQDKFAPLTKGSYIGIYFSLGVGQCLLNFAFSVFISYYGATASQTIFLESFKKVLRAPMSFFDTTPLGRITNRFSKDVDTLDNMITDSIRYFLITFTMIISVFILTSSFYPLFLAAFAPLAVIFIAAAQYYRASARDIKRYESILRSNLYAKFLEALGGIPTIKSYGLQRRFSANISEAIDDMNSAYFLTFANQRWLSMRFDIIASLLLLVTGTLVATSRLSIPPSTGGLVLAYLLSISQMLTFSVRQLAEIDGHMNATERLFHYIDNLEEEAPFDVGCSKVPNRWPQTGAISFENVSMQYRQGLPLVLSNLSLSIQGGERVGIVGRTGAGKSSIMATLFRLVELSSGQITVDGVNISTIGLRKLRENLTIIPQDPILFRGSLRYNLDPLGSHKDADLEDAIRRAGLNHFTGVHGDRQRQWGLDTAIEEDGRNLSLGQRQHIALARAVVRQSQIILCDEATSNVDLQTDMQIQKATLECFAGKTLICIAHRLRTVLGYDRICVLDRGKVVELGRPIELFESGGLFRRMCEANNIDKTEFSLS